MYLGNMVSFGYIIANTMHKGVIMKEEKEEEA